MISDSESTDRLSRLVYAEVSTFELTDIAVFFIRSIEQLLLYQLPTNYRND
jgi:hypothetical protein